MEKEPQNSSVFKEIGQEVREQVKPNFGYLKIDYFTLFWLFVAGSMFGLAVETIFHAIVYGGYESRAGLVWGPFSPIYGMGAVLLTSSSSYRWCWDPRSNTRQAGSWKCFGEP